MTKKVFGSIKLKSLLDQSANPSRFVRRLIRTGIAWSSICVVTACSLSTRPGVLPIQSAEERREAALAEGSGPYEAELGKLLANRDYSGVSARVRDAIYGPGNAMRQRLTNWLALEQAHGRTDTVFIGYLYALALLSQADHANGDDREKWRLDAVTAYKRTMFILSTELAQCRDQAVARRRAHEAEEAMSPAAAAEASLTATSRYRAPRNAFLLAALTFNNRYPDDFLCQPGGFRPLAEWQPDHDAAERRVLEQWSLPTSAASLRKPKGPTVVSLYR